MCYPGARPQGRRNERRLGQFLFAQLFRPGGPLRGNQVALVGRAVPNAELHVFRQFRSELAQNDAAAADKHLDDALAAYKQLEQLDVGGFKELGMYHQARVLQAKGDKQKAIELLKDVHKRVTEPGEKHPFSYLEFVVEDRLRALDPTALPPKAPKMGGPGGNIDMSNPEIQELLKKLQQQGPKGGAPQ